MKPKLLYPGCLAVSILAMPLHPACAGITQLINAPFPGTTDFPGGTSQPKLSSDGRFLAFASEADLLASDTNGKQDIYLLDRSSGALELISIGFRGQPPDGGSGAPSVSDDGRFVAFESSAANLEFTQDLRGYRDIFLRDRQTGLTRRISAGPDGKEANGDSFQPDVSADGAHVAFRSSADDLVGGDHNGMADIFVFHRQAGAVERVSVAGGGAEARCSEWFWPCSSSPAMSADGRYVAFSSIADNLVPEDRNGDSDIFVRDTVQHTTTRVSVASGGAEALCPASAFYCRGSYDPAISADGRYVAFASYSNNLVADDTNSSNSMDIFVRDRASGTTARVSVATGGSEATCLRSCTGDPASASGIICLIDDFCPGSDQPSISDDGRYVAFQSSAIDLAPDDSNGARDIFVRDTVLGSTIRASVADGGAEARCSSGQFCGDSTSPALSGDGGVLAFVSEAENLAPDDFNLRPDIFVRELPLGPPLRVSVPTAAGPLMRMANCSSASCSGSSNAAVSADGRYVAFDSGIDKLVAGDHDGFRDVFLRDTVAGTITRVSVASGGTEARCSGARYCYGSSNPAVNADGRYVAFQSDAGNLVPDDRNDRQDIFLRDTVLGTATRVSVANDGTEANGPSDNAAMSADGRYVAFESSADNLVPGDRNGSWDIFVRDTALGTTTRVSVANDGSEADCSGLYHCYGYGSTNPAMSADGRYVAFESSADNLVPGDRNASRDIFVRDLASRTTTRVSVASDGTEAVEAVCYDCLGSQNPAISADGRYVAFSSYAANLVPGDRNQLSDIFVHDTALGTTTRVSVASDGAEAGCSAPYACGSGSYYPAISADGRYVAFDSMADNLVADDRNEATDVFLRDMSLHVTRRISLGPDGMEADRASGQPSLSADGRYLGFWSYATNLAARADGEQNVFLHDRFADLRLELQASQPRIRLDQTMDLKVVIGNQGWGAASMTLEASLDGMELIDGPVSCAFSSGRVACLLGSLAEGGTAEYTLTLRPTALGQRSLNASVAVAGVPDPASNAAKAEVRVLPILYAPPVQADLAVELAASPSTVTALQPTRYTVKVRNLGPDIAAGAAFEATLLNAQPLSLAPGCAATGAQLSCPLGDLAAGAEAALALDVQAQSPGAVTVSVAARSAAIDPNPTNDSAALAVQTEASLPPGRVTLKIKGGKRLALGRPRKYRFAVRNQTGAALDETALTIQMPSSLAFRNASPGCAHDPDAHAVACALGRIGPGGKAAKAVWVVPREMGTAEVAATTTGAAKAAASIKVRISH